MLLHLEICQQSRPWECGNPEGISKECGKGGKPASWLSMLSILLSFPWPALETRFTKSQSPRRPVLGTGTTCPRCRTLRTSGSVSFVLSYLHIAARFDRLHEPP